MSKRKKVKQDKNVVDPTPFIKDLNEDQLLAFSDLVRFIDTPVDGMVLLKGFAGVGKTYLLTRFIQYCLQLQQRDINTFNPIRKHAVGRPNIAMTAPTNKAVQVLRESSDRSLFGSVHFQTIHQLLGLKEVINDSGIVEFRNDSEKFPDIQSKNILIIDEVSMLQDELFFLIKRYMPTIKIILTGDPAQIPPVGKEDAEPLLNPDAHNIQIIEMNKIMRQKEGSQILNASMQIRSGELEYNTRVHGIVHPGNDLSLYDAGTARQDLRERLESTFRSEGFISNPDSVKVIAWRNAKVSEYNRFIRKVYGSIAWPDIDMSSAPKVLSGDRMLANEPVLHEKADGSTIILLYTNQEFKVLSVQEESAQFEWVNGTRELSFYMAEVEFYNVETESMSNVSIRILHESSERDHNTILERIKSSALYASADKRKFFWREFYRWKRLFANVTYSYALTAHKGQGSTYKNVVVDVNDIMLNPNIKERTRILYTAVTRAKDSLILIN